MGGLKLIAKPVEKELEEFNHQLKSSLKTPAPLLDKILRYIVRRKGKQMRPLFVLLSAGACGGIRPSSQTAAVLIELLHTATLVHDDVVDDSYVRRGMFSVNALWKNKIAVLVGDYLLSRGMLISLEKEAYGLLKIVSAAVKDMSEGELMQIEKARSLNIDEDIYFEIIRKKTASLIASCCATGAASSGADEETISRMRRFGECTGIAFQIKDDLFDFQKNNQTGKPGGLDLKERKLSLPVIHLLKHLPASERRKMISVIRHHHNDPEHVKKVSDMVNSGPGMAYAESRMKDYRDEAIGLLSGLPPSDYRTSLEQLVDFTIERNF